ncbi:hypothetical protein X726_31865 [Mesorhizobium sp. L103C105A0]|nr:hypothetical protein X726_31865 [Mesorhizobium sp. L103C105A0]
MVGDSLRSASSAPMAAVRPNIAVSRAGVDIISGTLGKALGGASCGYTSGKRQVVDWLRQRSRPYLFSNTLMPAIAGASIKVYEMIRHGDAMRQRLYADAERFRTEMRKLGFTLAGADHPIIPVMLGDAALAQESGAHAEARHLCHRLLVSSGAEGAGAHPYPDVGCPFQRGH